MEHGQNCRNNFFECPFWCRECGVLLDGPCVMHGVSIRDNEPPENGLPANTSLVDYSLPTQLAFANKKVDNHIEVREVITKQRIGILTVFGPMVCPLTMTFGRQGLMVKKSRIFGIRYPNGTVATCDFKSPLTCNWTSQVRLEPNRGRANLMAFQHLDKVFFASVKDIPAGSELCVAYSRIYACAIGKDSIVNNPMNVEQKFFRCYNETGFRHHDLHDLPSLYFPPGITVPQYMVAISKGTAQSPAVTVEPASEEVPVSDSDVSEERSVASPQQAEPVMSQDTTMSETSISKDRPDSPEIFAPQPKRIRRPTPPPSVEKERSVSPEIPLPVPRLKKNPAAYPLVAQPAGQRYKIPQPMLEKLFPKSGAFGRPVPINVADLDPERVDRSSVRQKVAQPNSSSAVQTPQAAPVVPPNQVTQNVRARCPPRSVAATTAINVSAPGTSSVRPPPLHLPPLDPNALTAYYSGFLSAIKQIPANIASHQLVFNLPHPTDSSRNHRIVLNPQQRPSVAPPSRPMLTPSRPGGPAPYHTPFSGLTVEWLPPKSPQPSTFPSPSTIQASSPTFRRLEAPHAGPREPVLTSMLNARQPIAPSGAMQTTFLHSAQRQPQRQLFPQPPWRPVLVPQAQPVQMAMPSPYGSTPPRLIPPNLTNQPGFHPLQHTFPGLPPNHKVVTLPPSMVGPSNGTTQMGPPEPLAQQLYILQSLSGQSFLHSQSRRTLTLANVPKAVSGIPRAQPNLVSVGCAATSSEQGPQTLRTLLKATSAARPQNLGRKTITRPPRKNNKKKATSETVASSESDTDEDGEAEETPEASRRVLRSVYSSKERTPIVDPPTESASGVRRKKDSDSEWEPDNDELDTLLEDDFGESATGQDPAGQSTLETVMADEEAGEMENDRIESHGSADEGLAVFRMVNNSLEQAFPGGLKDRVEVKLELVDLS